MYIMRPVPSTMLMMSFTKRDILLLILSVQGPFYQCRWDLRGELEPVYFD